jgi:precorrin-2 dehydrogenase/sirohydrochlorin ferrochelatase
MNINFDLTNKKILIVGAGKVALRRLRKIVSQKMQCKIKIISPSTLPKIDSIADNNKNISIFKREYKNNDLKNQNIILACTNELHINEKISHDAIKSNLLVNNASDKELSNFFFTSNIKLDKNINLNINTNGSNPLLSKVVRLIIEESLKNIICDLNKKFFSNKRIASSEVKDLKHQLSKSDILKKINKIDNKAYKKIIKQIKE